MIKLLNENIDGVNDLCRVELDHQIRIMHKKDFDKLNNKKFNLKEAEECFGDLSDIIKSNRRLNKNGRTRNNSRLEN